MLPGAVRGRYVCAGQCGYWRTMVGYSLLTDHLLVDRDCSYLLFLTSVSSDPGAALIPL